MTAFIVALCASLALAFWRLAATAFEAAYYCAKNGERSKAWRFILRGIFCAFWLSLMIAPVVRFFDSFDVISIDEAPPTVAPKRSTDLRV